MKTFYPSAVDAWIVLVLIGAPLTVVGGGVFVATESTLAGLVQIGVGLGIGCFIALLAFPCRYTLDDERLTIQCGMIKEDITLDQIKGVEESSSLWSAPALSLKRVKVFLGHDEYRLISPKNRADFILTLKQKIQK
jgi:hypothetical protein